MTKRIIFAILFLLTFSTAVNAAGSGVYGGEGETTMYGIRAAWEENGYPDYVSYAIRDGRGALPFRGARHGQGDKAGRNRRNLGSVLPLPRGAQTTRTRDGAWFVYRKNRFTASFLPFWSGERSG